VSNAPEPPPPGKPPRPDKAIDARRRAAAAKVTAVEKAVKTLGRTGAPITRAGVAQLAGVSRSFTYENDKARAMITDAQTRTQARVTDRVETMTAQQEASWRERALNAEDQIRTLHSELTTQRRLVADLMGQLRQPDGTWVQDDRNRLRETNEHLIAERDQLAKDRNELQRRLAGARANIAHLNSRHVTELFPAGPGQKTQPLDR
jgi:chromosome segregation ATPase